MLPMLALAPCDMTGSTSTSLQSVRTPIAELKGTALLWDCVDITGDTTNAKGCIFCGLKFPGGPSRIGEHLLASPGKHVKVCKPDLIWQQRYKEVVAELRRRAQNAQQEADLKARKESARLLVSSPTIMNTFGKPTNELVTETWAKALVAKGLAIDLVDDPHFRAAITITARAGMQYVDGQKGTCMLPHRTCMSKNVLPALDKKLTDQVEAKITGLIQQTGAMIISDGWTSIQSRAIVNALLATPSPARVCQA